MAAVTPSTGSALKTGYPTNHPDEYPAGEMRHTMKGYDK